MADTNGKQVSSPDLTAKGTPRQRRPRQSKATPEKKVTGEVSAAAVQRLHEVVIVALNGACLFAPPHLHPTEKEVDGAFIPLERIYLRHASVPILGPDVTDALAALSAIGGYGFRVFTSRREPGTEPGSGSTGEQPRSFAAFRSARNNPATAASQSVGAQPGPTTPASDVDAIMADIHAASMPPDPGTDEHDTGDSDKLREDAGQR